MDSSLDGVLVVDKPAGPTSHDIVDRVRRAFGLRRVGHTGTLDPFATGVLAVCLGKATRLARFLAEGEKVYRATIRLGFATTTDDATGEPMGEALAVHLDPAALQEALTRFSGSFDQVPPAYSAKHVGGRRLYELARRGEAEKATAARMAVPVTVHAIELLGTSGDLVEIEVRCGPGTYIRALGRDIGESLGLGGHLAALRRLRSGAFGLEHAVAADLVVAASRPSVIPLSGLLEALPAVKVSAEGREAVRHGRSLGRVLVPSGFPESPFDRVRVLDESGQLLALAVPRGFGLATPGLPLQPVLQPDVVLVD
ncbi:MAG: tRNA pseudouridine(55) synthase TruB [Solirubrobacterales bacterium]|jgi:tRNA pseudouridine55 synthase